MILYQLQCDRNHDFEAWFRDSAAYDQQAEGNLLACPVCGSESVSKALMAPRIGRSSPRQTTEPPEGNAKDNRPAQRPDAVAMRRMLLTLQRQIKRDCDYVGPGFAEEARRIHYGETDPHGIYGEASADETKMLAEEGIKVRAIPWIPEDNA